MISKKMERMLNEHIKEEFDSSAIYLAISAWCSANDLNGTALFFRKQAEEENAHGMRIYEHLFNVDARAIVPAVAQPPVNYDSVMDIFTTALEYEQHITGCINKLVDLANQEKDYATLILLNWFVTEQIEEEATFKSILATIKMIGTDGRGLYLLDRELGQRQQTSG